MSTPALRLGQRRTVDGRTDLGSFDLPAHDLLTHAVIVGTTGSGKTGLVTVMIEEALDAGIPALVVDVKGDLPNLALSFPTLEPAAVTPWIEAEPGDADGIADPPVVDQAIERHRTELAAWSISERQLADHAARTLVRIVTPGADAGEELHLLSALERPSDRWSRDPDGARAALSSAISLVLRLAGRDGDPSHSREHALLHVLAERRLVAASAASLEALVPEVIEPPVATVGALPVEQFLSARARAELAADLNTLIASPTLASWRRGQDLDVARWMQPVDGRTPATIVSVAHLDETERQLVLGVLLEEVLSWVRSLPGSGRLRALVVMDEVYGLVPPHPSSPPTKRPIVSLFKQARAFGVGCVLATQNPMDLDYRALSNAGTWVLGRLPTDADRQRVMDALGEDKKKSELASIVKRLGSRWFVVREAKRGELALLHPRWAMSLLRGPMTPSEIRRARRPLAAATLTESAG